MKPPPPGPATNGIVTPSALAVATAASTALPPCFSTSMPAWLAPASIEATAPPEPVARAPDPPSPPPPRVTACAPAGRAGRASSTAASADTAETTGWRRMSIYRFNLTSSNKSIPVSTRCRETSRSGPPPPGEVEVGDGALERLGRQGHRLRQGGVRMDGQADVGRVRAHLDGQHRLGDEVARRRTDDAAADDPA